MADRTLGTFSSSSNPASSLSGTTTDATVANELVIASLQIPNSSVTPITVTFDGNTMTAIGTNEVRGNFTLLSFSFFDTVGRASGKTISASWTNAGTNGGGGVVMAVAAIGNLQTGVVDAIGGATGLNQAPTTNNSGALSSASDPYKAIAVIAANSIAAAGQATADNTYTALGESWLTGRQLSVQLADKQFLTTPVGVQAETWTVTWGVNKNWMTQILLFKEGAVTTPINTVLPAVTGTTAVGQLLSTTDGTWTNAPTSFTYQWQRDTAGSGAYSNIGGATSATYTLVTADAGCHLQCIVTAINANGSTTATSNIVGTILGVPTNTVAPVASGTAIVAQTLSVTNGTWLYMSGGSFAYQWQRDVSGNAVYSNIGGATSSTYVLAYADFGCHVRCTVTATNTLASTPLASNALGLITAPAPINSVAPVVSGTAAVGSTLTTTNGTWTDSGSSAFTYQWQRDAFGNGVYSNIAAATASTYALVTADDGCNIRCIVTDTDVGGPASATSNSIGTVTEGSAPSNTVAPAVTGTDTVGQTLTTTNGTWTLMGGHGATFTYQWKRDNFGGGTYANIGGAVATTYVLVDADDSCQIKCTVTATNDVGSTARDSNVGSVVEPAPTNTVAPVVSGLTEPGQTLTTTNGTWSNMGGHNATFTYQWQEETSPGSGVYADIAGATNPTLLL